MPGNCDYCMFSMFSTVSVSAQYYNACFEWESAVFRGGIFTLSDLRRAPVPSCDDGVLDFLQ